MGVRRTRVRPRYYNPPVPILNTLAGLGEYFDHLPPMGLPQGGEREQVTTGIARKGKLGMRLEFPVRNRFDAVPLSFPDRRRGIK